MTPYGNIRLIAGLSNRPLAEGISRRISIGGGRAVDLPEGPAKLFSDGEIGVKLNSNVRGEDVFIIQSTSTPVNDHLMELLIIIDAVRRSSAARITAVIPYFGYARQDRRIKARTPITAKLKANLLTEAGANRVLTLDLHAGQIQGFFDIPTDNLYAAPVFALDIKHQFRDRLENVITVSPDAGGVVRARELADHLGSDLAIIDKKRERDGVVGDMILIGEVEDRDCVIIDDMADSAGTLCRAAGLLREKGARSVHAYVSHGVLSNGAVSRVNASVLDGLVITDSIQPTAEVLASDRIRVLPLAPLLGQAILNVANDTSVSSLFSEEFVAPLYEGRYGAD